MVHAGFRRIPAIEDGEKQRGKHASNNCVI